MTVSCTGIMLVSKMLKIMTNSGTAFIQGTGYTEGAAIRDYARYIKLHKMILPKGHTVSVWNLV